MKARKVPNRSKPVATSAVVSLFPSQIIVSGNPVSLLEFFTFMREVEFTFRKKSYPSAGFGWATFIVVFKTAFGNRFAEVLMKYIESRKAEVYIRGADGSEKGIKAGSRSDVVKIAKATSFRFK